MGLVARLSMVFVVVARLGKVLVAMVSLIARLGTVFVARGSFGDSSIIVLKGLGGF